MSTRMLFSAAAFAASATFGLAGTAGASASTTPSPSPPVSAVNASAMKSHCNNAVQRRLGTLGADATFVKQSAALTATDRATLESQISADQAGLAALDTKIQADTTPAQVKSDCMLIVTDYRVYVLEDPKIHEVIAADGISDVNSMFATLDPQLQSLINASREPASVKAQAQTELNDLMSKVTAATTSISGVSASIINQQPGGWPGNKVTLQSAQQNIDTARDDLVGARADAGNILKLLGT